MIYTYIFVVFGKDDIIPTCIHLHTFVHDTSAMHIAPDKILNIFWLINIIDDDEHKSDDWIVSLNNVSNVALEVVNQTP